MNIELSAEALAYGRLARQAIEAAGGDGLVQDAEREPERRENIFAPVFGELGAWDLDPRGDPDDLEAAAALCRAAGYWGIAYPVAERLARPAGLEADGLVVVAEAVSSATFATSASVTPVAPVACLDLRWAAVTPTGRRSRVVATRPTGPPRTSAFVASLELAPVDDNDGANDVALGLVLPCWTLLGMLDRAIDLARAHVVVREQFGQPISGFQSVQFQLTDAEVERSGVDVLAKYALWSIQAALPEAVDDALALRLAALEAAEVVFRVSHQLHGAIGFCDEMPLSWLSRYSQPLRRLPLGLSATRAALTARLGRHGLTGVFSE
jgi:3-oxo-4-pregnene-20-carboxyl-CoA dehydrogenase alpha subunit